MTSDSETKALLDNGQDPGQPAEPVQYASLGCNQDVAIRVIVIILFVIGLEMGGLTKNQYVYKWIETNSNSTNTALNASHENSPTTSLDPCGSNISAGNEKTDQSEATLWLLYFSLCEHGISIPMILLYGSYSDFVGRKPLMIIPCIGNCIQYAIKAFIVYKNLPLVYFFIAYVCIGLCGGHYPFYLAMMASVADKTDSNNTRAFGIAIVEAVIGVGVCAAQVGTGYLIKDFGYMYPMVATSGIFGLCFFIVVFGVSDTRSPTSTKHITLLVYLKQIFGMFLSKSHIATGSVFTFNMTMLSFFLLYMVATVFNTIGTLYELRSPFCWDSRTIGWYGFGTDIVQYVFGLFVVKGLQMCLSHGAVIILALLSSIATCVITGLATSSLMLYISKCYVILSRASYYTLTPTLFSCMWDRRVKMEKA
ncbi:proton-coupled folate transporter-like [Mizuhopecten yessoensis]|uniref:proton-coupled folate transporter-like n=1 Tax=Mizuhopecten yessoensis TaxID=6573 RepID=UPI000B45C743|nr:proton-coupled folate transporter-like [Mizuhopecten yessoensis]